MYVLLFTIITVFRNRVQQGRRKHFDIGAASIKDNAISH